MGAKKMRNARITFSLMVPITIGAFALAHLAEPSVVIKIPETLSTGDVMDITALVTVAIGVWMYNWFEEKPQKASIENL